MAVVYFLLVSIGCFLLTFSLVDADEGQDVLGCFMEDDSLGCVKNLTDASLDQIELQVTGNRDNVTFSQVIERTSDFVMDQVNHFFDDKDPADTNRESRKIKIGKKKKKLLHKLLPIFHLFQAKISLLLQLVSTHFQFKFFAIAVIGLIINFIRLWIDIKKGHHPAKVIYYEHAQHQHHYEPEEEPSYWKKRSLDTNNQLAFSSWPRR
ncbi:uncharacterized protein LOC103580253 [Microplitis demolitor]|uniref:uncharacterized protein LOC103580253 n=1 Tax=Microplitis demolitor TaxID=69319 RepID=UPI0004400033|nr:uncharacterized protein LOC103580253 [Microplitis demolitor]